jgi:hypothetical protein
VKPLRPSQRALRAPRAGLTILEVVLAMGILAMGMAAIISIFTSAAALGVSARQRAEAAAALEYVVADVSERLFPLDEDGNVLEPARVERAPVPGFERLTFSAVASLAAQPPGPGLPPLYRVDITIHWSEQGRDRGLEHSTLLPGAVSLSERLRRDLYGIEPIEATLKAPVADASADSDTNGS